MDLNAKIADLEKQIKEDIKKPSVSSSDIRLKYFSKKHGKINEITSHLATLNGSDKKRYGKILNDLINDLEIHISNSVAVDGSVEASVDLTSPSKPKRSGCLHPTTQTIREMNKFFRYYGYSIAEGPEIETVEYNFRILNLPEDHPATDLQDTLFVKQPDILLRTHTSSIESRLLKNQRPPIRAVMPGKVYRNETPNKSNDSFFHHYQGVVVEKGITMQHLKGILEMLHKFLFGDDIELRFRYKYYPEVSPGMGVDMKCRLCNGKGCDACKHRGWMEMLGSGMIHYNTLKMCGIDPEKYTGFAFGMGLDRIVMQKFNIDDIRKLYGEEMVYK